MDKAINRGHSFPLGATASSGGVNFSLYSENASSIEIVLFRNGQERQPYRSIFLTKENNRSGNYWHVFVNGLEPGTLYGYRATGPVETGNCFDSQKLLLDPYGLSVFVPEDYSRLAASQPGCNTANAMKSVVVDIDSYNWEEDLPLNRPWINQIVYELHCGGFTRHAQSGVTPDKRGTFLGLIEKIPYLYDLGITSIQFMPVYQFDEQDCPAGLVNYWGYSPVSLFAPHRSYCTADCRPQDMVNQFRDMVKALHRAEIEIILDITPGFTSEGDALGPILSYKGLDNRSYYLLGADKKSYQDCFNRGNTINFNNSIARQLVIDSLRHWVGKMHVDGFKIDLAMLLQRNQQGEPSENQPLLEDIAYDAVLAGTKFIFNTDQAFCAEELLRLFSNRRLITDKNFTHSLRRFIKSTEGATAQFAQEIFPVNHDYQAINGHISSVTSHNGFTLNDLVSFNHKNNFANQEDNTDGAFENESWNCGHEGLDAPVEVENLRVRQIKNFLACILLARGVPFIQMGDEIRRSQQGNNNAYCQNNEISWLDWRLFEKHRPLRRFVKILIEQRKLFLNYGENSAGLAELMQGAHISWHGVKLNQPDWSSFSHSIAATIQTSKGGLLWHCMFNAYWQPLEFEVPPLTLFPEHSWRRWIDTSREPPEDICDWQRAGLYGSTIYTVPERSMAVLIARPPK